MRSRRLQRCSICGLSPNLCVCAALPALAPTRRVVILAHRIELSKSTNTGRLAARMLGERAELATSDAPWQPSPQPGTWVLFPSDDALPLEQIAGEVNTLIVPDGTWQQARRIARRHARCRDLNKVWLASPPPSRYALRRSALRSGLCTLEAIAHALRILEGDACADVMLAAFGDWVERALRVRAGAHHPATHEPARSPAGLAR